MTTAVPAVSVVVPTHNRLSFLPLTVSSVLRQQGITVEVLVVDDGSADDVRAEMQSLEDDRVRVLRHESPLGVSAARNTGVSAAQGTWIAFVDDDDVWAPDKLISQVGAAEQQDRVWGYAGAVNVTSDLRLIGGAPPADPAEVVARLTQTNLVPGGCSTVIVRRDVLPPNPFDSSMGTCADWDLWIRLSRIGQPAGVNRPLTGYRIHGGNMSLDTGQTIAEFAEIEKRYGGPIDWVAFHRHLARVCLRGGRHLAAANYYRRAAANRGYRREDFLADLAEVAQDAGRRLQHRIARTLNIASAAGVDRKPARRYLRNWEWVEQARPWLDDLARVQRELGSRR